jgi:hypothetical protein
VANDHSDDRHKPEVTILFRGRVRILRVDRFLAASTECSAGSNDHFVVGGAAAAFPSLVQFDGRPLGGANFQHCATLQRNNHATLQHNNHATLQHNNHATFNVTITQPCMYPQEVDVQHPLLVDTCNTTITQHCNVRITQPCNAT